MLGLSRMLVLAAVAAVLPSAALANAQVDFLKGTAQVGAEQAYKYQRVSAGQSVTTGPQSQLVLNFDDDMKLVLGADTELRIVDFRYARGATSNRAVLDLIRGSLRVVTGTVARSGEGAFSLRTPQASFAVRSGPADFTVALVNPAYLSVARGQVAVTNSYGTAAFGPGATAQIANSAALAAAIPPAQIPPVAAASLQSLGAASVAPAGGVAYGAPAATIGTGGQSYGPMLLVIGVAAVAAAAASSSDDGVASTPQHP